MQLLNPPLLATNCHCRSFHYHHLLFVPISLHLSVSVLSRTLPWSKRIHASSALNLSPVSKARYKPPLLFLRPPPSFLLTSFVYFALFRYPESVVDGWFCWNSLGIHFWVSRSYHKGGKNFNFLLWKVSNCSALSTPLVWTHLLLVLLWRNGQVIEHCCLLIWNY